MPDPVVDLPVLDVPAGWSVSGAAPVNRATQREVLATNGPVAGLPTIPGNGDIDPAALPAGRVVVAVQSFCRLSCMGPESETALPPDWAQARPLADRVLPAGKHEIAVAFRWFDRPMHLVARWTDDEWSRFGRYLGTEPQRDLPQHTVFVRDGTIFVHYARTTLLEPAVKDEAAER